MVFDPQLLTEDLIEERWQAANQPAALETLRAMYGSEARAPHERARAEFRTPSYWSMLHKVQCPTLMVWGCDDRQCPLAMAQVPLRSRMPSCTFCRTADTGCSSKPSTPSNASASNSFSAGRFRAVMRIADEPARAQQPRAR